MVLQTGPAHISASTNSRDCIISNKVHRKPSGWDRTAGQFRVHLGPLMESKSARGGGVFQLNQIPESGGQNQGSWTSRKWVVEVDWKVLSLQRQEPKGLPMNTHPRDQCEPSLACPATTHPRDHEKGLFLNSPGQSDPPPSSCVAQAPRPPSHVRWPCHACKRTVGSAEQRPQREIWGGF